VYFVTQNPTDVPDRVLGQLGNRVQHALRAFSANDRKTVKAAAETFRANPKLDVVKAITELGVGEALVSVLDAKGTPSVVERALVLPPGSRLTPLSPEERAQVVGESVLRGHYERLVDRESAYEKLKEKAAQRQTEESAGGAESGRRDPEARSRAGGLIGAMAKSAAHAIGSQLGRQIIRGVLGSILGGRR
jgi:DNA helicase HerA-like ATPase